MADTPPEIERILQQMRDVLTTWHEKGTLGEVAVLGGQNDWQVEERPNKRKPRIKRSLPHGKPIVRVTP